jgi:signal transduction histidine kinase
MLSHPDSTHLCQLTAAQIQEILVLNGVLIQQYQPQSHRWITIVQLPEVGQLMLGLEPDKVQEIDLGLHRREIIEFTATTTVMNINICDRYVFIPLLDRTELWGRICLLGNLNSVWTPQDLSWVQALGQQLLTAMNVMTGITPNQGISTVNSSSPLADLAELIERITELESLCQRKDEFINNISHDLRAPLMNIKMAVRMLKISLNSDRVISELLAEHKAEKYLAILEQECEREVELINNILDLQRLELAIEQVQLESVEIATWLPMTIEPFIHRAGTRRQQLTTSCSDWMPTVATNRMYLTKILTELLNNACKYTNADGKIFVAIDSPPNSEWLTITIKNQADIEAQHLTRIFDQFYRIPGSDRSAQGGTGLGLSLVQKLVAQLNGEIDVASINGWTEFAVKLPVGVGNRG